MTATEEVFNIINPSDKYTINGERRACIAAVAYLGDGQYGLDTTDGENVLPVLFLPGEEAIPGTLEQLLGEPFADYWVAHRLKIADALDNVVVGDAKAFALGLEHAADKDAFRAMWHDANRSSLNDIGGAARELAKAIRKKAASEAADDQGPQ